MGSVKLRRWLAALAIGAAAVTGLGTAPAGAAPGSTDGSAADPDMVQSGDHFDTSSTGRTGGPNVPVRITPTAGIGGTKPAKDAMPDGPGSWAMSCKAIWAPSVVYYNGKWRIYYTATKAGTASCADPNSNGQKCIGTATSKGGLAGPYTVNRRGWACPAKGRWAIDPDAFVSGGRLYVVYRDDAVTSGAETGISVVRTDSNGNAVWSTRQTLLTSTQISWDTRGSSAGTRIVENPSLIKAGETWRLFFSGNKFASKRYAVGLASCGSKLMDNRCTPTHVNRPWFGYTGAGGIDPIHGLPGNHPGPGGLSVFRNSNGTAKVVWHWWADPGRPALSGTMGSALTVS